MILIQQLVAIVLFLVESIFKILKSVGNLEELEAEIQRVTQEASAKVLAAALERIDERLMQEREVGIWENIGLRSRQMVTSFGEVTFKRRLYKNRRTGEYSFLLDEVLGWEEKRSLSPRMERLAVEMGTEMPFRRASVIMSYLVPGISAMTVWEMTKKAGELARADGRLKQAGVFEHGNTPEGRKRISDLFIEADGVLIRQQRSSKRHDEVKLVVAYEGKGGRRGRRKLVNREVVAGTEDGHSIWEEASAVLGEKWDLGGVERVFIGGDGATWPKQGTELFPHSVYQLDEFHLKRRITEALAHSRYFSKVQEGLRNLDLEAVTASLNQAAKNSQGTARKKIQAFKQYLIDNWDGITSRPEEARLGAIEAEVRHTICRRMKRLGARWTPAGTNRMARLLAAKANGDLSRYIIWSGRGKKAKVTALVGEAPVEKPPAGIDREEWLRAKVPVLYGPNQGRPWVKYIIRELVKAG